jgi:pyruvate,water dikinase
VAREMGIPAIVGARGIKDILKDGDIVEMDGSTGLIKKE